MMNGFARKWDVNFLSSFGLFPFILNFIKKFSTRLVWKVVRQLRRGEKGKAQQDDDNAVSLSSLPLLLSTLRKLIPLQYSSRSHQDPEN